MKPVFLTHVPVHDRAARRGPAGRARPGRRSATPSRGRSARPAACRPFDQRDRVARRGSRSATAAASTTSVRPTPARVVGGAAVAGRRTPASGSGASCARGGRRPPARGCRGRSRSARGRGSPRRAQIGHRSLPVRLAPGGDEHDRRAASADDGCPDAVRIACRSLAPVLGDLEGNRRAVARGDPPTRRRRAPGWSCCPSSRRAATSSPIVPRRGTAASRRRRHDRRRGPGWRRRSVSS